jgi:hypothetical protein
MVCCVALQTAPLNVYPIYASRFGFLRALHLNIFEQPPSMKFLNDPTISIDISPTLIPCNGSANESARVYNIFLLH